MNNFLKRTWAEIDLHIAKENYLTIRKIVNPKSKIMCIVKADAYGHGAEFLSKTYENLGADFLGVSNLEEAIQIRKANVKLPILILGYTPVYMAKELHKYKITQTVFSKEYAEKLSEFCEKENIKLDIHIKIDTGMSRIGIMYQNPELDSNSINLIENICKLNNISVKGMFTHFSVSDDLINGKEYTQKQFSNFINIIKKLKEKNIIIPLCHCCNSGGIIEYPEMHLDMVRAGIILYGLAPSEYLKDKIKIKPVMQLKSVISQIKEIRAESSVSYGRTFKTSHKTKLATIPIGYADGYPRNLSNKAYMLINGEKAPIIGRVCMDQLMLDVTNIKNINENSIVTVFGQSEDNYLSVNELSKLSNTINYEFICILGKRVPRIYFNKNKKIIGQLNYII